MSLCLFTCWNSSVMRRVWLCTFRVFMIRTIAASTWDTKQHYHIYIFTPSQMKLKFSYFQLQDSKLEAVIGGDRERDEKRNLILAILEHPLGSACVFLYCFLHLNGINLQIPQAKTLTLNAKWAWELKIPFLVQVQIQNKRLPLFDKEAHWKLHWTRKNHHPPHPCLLAAERRKKIQENKGWVSDFTSMIDVYMLMISDEVLHHQPFGGPSLFHKQGIAEFSSVPCPRYLWSPWYLES